VGRRGYAIKKGQMRLAILNIYEKLGYVTMNVTLMHCAQHVIANPNKMLGN
jgi:hypothetical protein